MSDRPGVPELDGEQEVDLRSAWRRLVDHWWLPVGGLILGAVLGVLVSLSGGKVWEARTLVYLGQPFTPGGGGQIQSLQTNPRTVGEIIRSQAALEQAAKDSGLRIGQLRGNVTSQAITSPGTARNLSPLVEIVVQAPQAVKAERAAASLTDTVVTDVSVYVERKIELLDDQITNAEQQLAQIDRRIAAATEQQRIALADPGLSLSEKLLVSTNSNATINNAEQRRSTVFANLNSAQQLLSLAQTVERSQVIEGAAAKRTSATSRRTAAVVGALVGLLLGAVAAWLWEPLAARRKGAADA
ncbi:MAG: Wzz/FepE/Etk N-terminal domain-containing protein [Thermoleophilia bacterium]|nr:Wzz/FepE/Etk N-terminal domain-containing protein [Thermoleophilia bacterium]MDH5333416.1 Wzz/FepE/Etk N-terminal domain-containing protein [Thermoleophilia bacterium]